MAAPDLGKLEVEKETVQDSNSRLVSCIQCCEADMNGTVEDCVKVSMEGVGGLGIEHWVGDCENRPFDHTGNISYRGLLAFVLKNRERSSDSQDFLHYISPWYEWALVTAESKMVSVLLSKPDLAAYDKKSLVQRTREIMLLQRDSKYGVLCPNVEKNQICGSLRLQ
eukprot:Gb_12178 [translate_table: standard]